MRCWCTSTHSRATKRRSQTISNFAARPSDCHRCHAIETLARLTLRCAYRRMTRQ
ncbi:hypothetical protein [Lysobacter gummosus]|uniref:hypothetical protein n=1 Tax=Lysobacter gummosus TaxID=262324 RepID=UPI0036415ABD